ncbi:MAG: peptidoglycan DD-metalloendopeptidase family protein [bacterium]|nr:peptidoglycan DD-metalloendopeptidase family protein [bacterium]
MVLLAAAVNLDPNPAVGGGDITVDGSALVAREGPSGTGVDITDRHASSQISVYSVRSDDTLSGIAKMFDVTINTIVWANNIKNGVIRPGDTLIVLPITGVQHTVAKGETLASIANTFKSEVLEIAQYNDLAVDAALTVGDNILIPDGEIPAPPVDKSMTSSLRGAGGPSLSGYYAWPIATGIITQGLHGYNGVDIGAPKGTSIFSAAAGTVIISRQSGYNVGYGSYVVIQHDNGTQTLYAHASEVLVSAGQSVIQGQTIAKVGATGKATGNHLHFEVRGAANPFAN